MVTFQEVRLHGLAPRYVFVKAPSALLGATWVPAWTAHVQLHLMTLVHATTGDVSNFDIKLCRTNRNEDASKLHAPVQH
jgi:hypothetical protein